MAADWPVLALAGLFALRPLSSLLAAGLLTLFVLLTVLIWTRFGQAKPVAKCVILSLLAHLLLLVYAYSTHVLAGPPGRWTGQIVKVRLRDAADDTEAAPANSAASEPAERASPAEAPSQLAAAAETTDEPADARADAIEPAAPPASAIAAVEQQPPPPANPPVLTDLLDDRSANAVAPVTSATSERPPSDPEPLPATLMAATAPTPPATDQSGFVAMTNSATPRRLGDGQEVPEALQGRIQADRLQAAQPFGATPQSEAAVLAALGWLASAQSSDGRWDADAHGAGRETKTLGHDRRGAGANADTGVSGLALLAFLGSGETHLAGEHRECVQHGLEFLLASQSGDGSLAGNAELFAAMYCHGIATLALSEAYALSGDERLLEGLRRALQYSISAQSSAGGWRYRPNEPSDPGDMSQFGWQVMALKSAEMGGLAMPAATRVRMVRFLQGCSLGKRRGLAGYRPGDGASRTMTAEALVCRYFLDVENTPPTLDEAAAYVIEDPPQQRGANYYYWYYGTLAMFQRQGDDWRRWNTALQAELLARQQWNGQLAGSFEPDDLWGGYGGRVYSTALAALCLEVYYRYLPLHGHALDDSRLTDRPGQPAMSR